MRRGTPCTLAAAQTETLPSYTLEKLPEPFLQRHKHASGYPAGVWLLEDTRVVA